MCPVKYETPNAKKNEEENKTSQETREGISFKANV